MKNLNWHAVIAVILTISVGIAVILLAASELDHGTAGHISEAESTLLATVLGASIGVVGVYVGQRERPERPEPPEPGENHLVYRWPEESRLKRPEVYDQDDVERDPDATQEYGAVTPEEQD